MLSILIPTYNYNVYPLVWELHKQCLECSVDFEIVVIDDGSEQPDATNLKINHLSNCNYAVLEKNIGRSAIRNLLSQRSKYNHLLFLDADTIPLHKNFISNYIKQLDQETKIVYGGIEYQKDRPSNESLLRWIYGKSREALFVKKREQNPYLSILTLNFLVHKSVFDKVTFNESIPNLRHEDTLFSYQLFLAKIPVIHIQNPVIHLGIETSPIFIKKSEEALVGLHFFLKYKLINPNYLSITKAYLIIEKLKLKRVIALGYEKGRPFFLKNLLGNHPSLLLFDFYRLSYLCHLKD